MPMMNSLGAEPQDAEAGAPHPLVAGMSALHDMTRARYDKLATAKSLLAKVRAELTPLAKMGDTVVQEDVINAAGKLVSHGLGAATVAGLLADMPPDGQALAAWVAQHMVGLQQREAQLAPVLTQTQHSLGVHAMQLLAANSMAGAQASAEIPTGPPEPLASPPAEPSLATPTNALGAAPIGGQNAG